MDVKTTCLGVLALGPASGYEIRKAFESGPFSHFAEGGYGSIYPALGKLTGEGLVTCTREEQDRRPDKKVYEITEAGQGLLIQRLSEGEPKEDRYKSDFLFMLFYVDYLPRAHVERIVDGRIAWYRERLAEMRECARDRAERPDRDRLAGPGFVLNMGIAFYTAALAFLERERDNLIAAAGRALPGRAAAE